MNRIVGILGATLLALTLLVPVAAAADPSRQDNHVVVNTSGDLTLPAGQHVDLLVVVDGTATIQGDVTGVIVVDGAVNFIGGRASDVFAVRSHVSLDGDSIVSGDIRTVDSEVQQPAGAVERESTSPARRSWSAQPSSSRISGSPSRRSLPLLSSPVLRRARFGPRDA